MHTILPHILFLTCLASKVWSASQTITSDFDDLQSNPIAVMPEDRITQPYDGLMFNGLSARQDGASILRSRSKPNTASSSTLDRQLAGAPPPNITSQYTGSKTKYYTLVSTYLGCGVTTEASTGVPQACQLLFTGTKTTGKTVQQTCDYSGTILNPDLSMCVFGPEFSNLVTVVVNVVRTLTTPTTSVLYLDDLTHINTY